MQTHNLFSFRRNINAFRSKSLQLLSKRSSFLLTVLIIIISVLFSVSSNKGYYYDAAVYNNLGLTFYNNGFSLLHFSSSLRGFLFPLIMYLVHCLSNLLNLNEIKLFRFSFSVVLSIFVTQIIPLYFKKITNRKVNFISKLVFSIIVLIFWIGYCLYPLSDFPSFIFIVLGFLLINYGVSIAFTPWWKSTLFFILAGLAFGASVNIRPSYQIVLIPIAFFIFVISWKRFSQWTTRLLPTALVAFGLFVVLIPQFYINFNNFKTASPFVIANVEEGNLFEAQLNWGIWMQRYDTYIGNKYPTPSVRYVDPIGEAILRRNNINYPKELLSIKNFIRLLIKNPVDFSIIYFKHFFNGMDITQNTPYIEDLQSNRIIVSWINYSIKFLGLSLLLTNLSIVKKNIMPIIQVIIITLPAFLSLPGAVETRFFLGIHVFLYAVVCFFPDGLRTFFHRRNFVPLLILYVVYLLFCFCTSYSVFSNLEYFTIL